jgi:hypothetical protein
MLIRTIALAVLVACSGEPPPADATNTESEVDQPITDGACQPPNYPCRPGNPWSETLCDVICGGDGFGGHGFCLPYSAAEVAWCAAHPGRFFRGNLGKQCDPLGNPEWETRCIEGYDP